MTILLTGAGGQVGREVQARSGHRKVVGLGRAALDIRDASVVQSAVVLHKAKLVINAAAYKAVDKAESEPEVVTTWYAFANTIFDEACAQGLIDTRPCVYAIPSSEYPPPARRPANSALDERLVAEPLHITRHPWTEGLREVLSIWKKDET